MPTARDHLAVVALGGKLYAIGGRASFFGTKYASVEIYDPANDSWQTGPPISEGRGGLAAAVLDGRIYVFGGELPFRVLNLTEMYDPATNSWWVKAPMPTGRHGLGAVAVGNRIYVVSGGVRPAASRSSLNEAFEP
jgi:N-acetylneuraminic acid mutarotase